MAFLVILLQKDTDVSEKILNVSFSVREKVEHNADVFYTTQFLPGEGLPAAHPTHHALHPRGKSCRQKVLT